MSQERKSCNLQPSPILRARVYVRSVRCPEAIATSTGGFHATYSSCQDLKVTRILLGHSQKLCSPSDIPAIQCRRWGSSTRDLCQPSKNSIVVLCGVKAAPAHSPPASDTRFQNHGPLTRDITRKGKGRSREGPEILSVLKRSHQRFIAKLEGKQVSWRLFSKGPPSKETTRVLAAGGFMEIYNTSAVHINRLIKCFHCFEVSFLQTLWKHLHLPHDRFGKLSPDSELSGVSYPNCLLIHWGFLSFFTAQRMLGEELI